MNEIQIALASDQNYLDFALIAITSILAHHPNGNLVINLIHSGLTSKDLKRFDALKKFGSFDLNPLFLDADKFYQQWGIRKATYYRLVLPSLRPDLNKIIYLDCDLIILDDIEKLWNVPLDGKMLAGVGDRIGLKVENKIHVPPVRYINAGVLLMNLEKMRAFNAENIMIKTFHEQRSNITYGDQDLLNMCFWQDCKMLPQKWNIVNSVYRNMPVTGMYTEEQVIAAIKEPGIVHFTGGHKPWKFRKTTHHPYAFRFWHFAFLAPVPNVLKLKLFGKRLITGYFKDSSIKRPWNQSILKKNW